MKTTLIFIRHGFSVSNKAKIYTGSTDIDLTETGKIQAEKCAELMAKMKPDAVYSSDLKRAMSTAEPNARLRGLEVIPDSRLRELYLGDWDGKSVREVAEQDHDMFFIQWRGLFGNFQSPNGESVPQLAERIYACLADLGRKYPGEVLLCATHAAAIRAFWGKKSSSLSRNCAKFAHSFTITVARFAPTMGTPFTLSALSPTNDL